MADEELKALEDQLRKLEDAESDTAWPKPPDKESVYKFFKHLIGLKDSSKIGNILKEEELGALKLSIRRYQDVANFSAAMNYDKVTAYLMGKSEIMLGTSLSRKGKLVELFVTNIRKETKTTKEGEKKKKGLFGGGKEE